MVDFLAASGKSRRPIRHHALALGCADGGAQMVLRERQDGQLRHSGVYSGMTWSPFLTEVTPTPVSTTTPAPSWPRIDGNNPSGSAPDKVNSSVWHTPVALISTRTSPARGPSSWTGATSSGWPGAKATAARTSMRSVSFLVYREAQ